MLHLKFAFLLLLLLNSGSKKLGGPGPHLSTPLDHITSVDIDMGGSRERSSHHHHHHHNYTVSLTLSPSHGTLGQAYCEDPLPPEILDPPLIDTVDTDHSSYVFSLETS